MLVVAGSCFAERKVGLEHLQDLKRLGKAEGAQCQCSPDCPRSINVPAVSTTLYKRLPPHGHVISGS